MAKYGGAKWKLIFGQHITTTIYLFGPRLIWWYSEHLARWFGKRHEDDFGYISYDFKSRVLGNHHWSNM